MIKRDQIVEDAFDAIFNTIAPQGAFLCRGEDDSTKYLVPVHVVEALAWIGLYVVLPIFISTVSNVVSTEISERKRKKEKTIDAVDIEHQTYIALNLQKREIDHFRSEISNLIKRFDKATAINETKKTIAQKRLSDVLQANGIPHKQAEVAARKSVLNLLDVLITHE